jgi:hypothetical protein
MSPAVFLTGFALFAVGFAVGAWWRGRIDRASPAVVREIREQGDRVIVAVLSEQARRAQDAEEARRALLYGRRAGDVEQARDTDPG